MAAGLKKISGFMIGLGLGTSLMCLISTEALAGPREQAAQLFSRINTVPPSAATLDALAAKITAGDARSAGHVEQGYWSVSANQQDHHP